MPQIVNLRFRFGSAILAVFAVGAALIYAVLQETPRGKLSGRVKRSDTGAVVKFARVVAYGTGGTFYASANDKGEFSFSALPAGTYDITAYSRSEAFRVTGASTVVDEGATANIDLNLRRARPDLQQTQQRNVFAPDEAVFLPVHGYINPNKSKNADVLHVKVWKTHLFHLMQDEDAAQALSQVASRWERKDKLPTVLLAPAKTSLVFDKNVPIREADAEGFYHKRVNLPTTGAGLYLVEVSHQQNEVAKTVCGWMNVTSTALILKKTNQDALAFVSDLQSGVPKKGFPISLFYDGKKFSQSVTDASGLATLQVPQGNEGKVTAVAQLNGDEAVLSHELYGDENSGNIVTHVYTDRPIYRPGQNISFKGIMRERHPLASAINDKKGEAKFVFADLHVKGANGFRSVDWDKNKPVSIEVRDPSGVQIYNAQKSVNNYGSFAGDFQLSPESPTGNYSLVTTIDGQETSTDITVAAYRKPEFEVTVTPAKDHYYAGEGMSMTIGAKYYFGSPVAGAKVRYEIYRNPDWSSDSDYYEDGSGEDYGYGEFIRDGEGVLDENGQLVVNFSAYSTTELESIKDKNPNLRKENSEEDYGYGAYQPQIFTAHATVTDRAEREVQGDGKTRQVVGDYSIDLQPKGYVAEPGKPSNFDITVRNQKSAPVANVSVELELGYWRYDEKNNTSNYLPLRTQKITTNAQGVASGALTPPRSGELQIIARTTDSGGRVVQQRLSLWAASENGNYADEGSYASDLSLFTDKKHYEAGQTARVLINSGKIGQSVLLTLEGERIYQSLVVPIRQRSTLIKISLRNDYGPNLYLAACYVKDKKFAQSEVPLRVHVAERDVKVDIQADKSKYAPGGAITYAVKTTGTDGKPVPAEFSFGVVDESIYALREDNPDGLRATFYPRRENRVSTSYSFATEYLGDANKAGLKIEPRRKFLDTAFWQPFAHTDANGVAKISFNLPDNLTQWRATAIAQTRDTAFGYQTEKVRASKAFFVRLEKPRFLTQNDNAQITAFIHNETGAPQQANLQLDLQGLDSTLAKSQKIEVAPNEVKEIIWPVTAEKFGDAKMTLSAWTDNRQFSDALEDTLSVRPHGREIVAGIAGQVTNRESKTLKLESNAIKGVSRLEVRVTPSVISALSGGLDYLTGYPYGCVEQTLSRFLPDILVSRLLKNGVSLGQKEASLKRELPAMVRDGLTRLYSMQHESGAWGWWEYDDDHPWMTAYVLYGLATARNAGFPVDEERFDNGRKGGLVLLAKATGPQRAFLLYALAISSNDSKDRAKISKECGKTDWKGWDAEPISYLLMANKILNRSDPKLQAAFERRVISQDGVMHFEHWESSKTNWNDYDYNDVTATSAALRAILMQNAKDSRVNEILRWLMARRTGDYWQSTRDTSCVLTALCDYLQSQPSASQLGGTLNVKLNGAPLKTWPLAANAGYVADLQSTVSGTNLNAGDNVVSFERSGGSSPVFYSLQLRQTIGSEDIQPLQSTVKVEREYLRETTPERGKKWEIKTEPTNNRLAQGDQIRVKLTLNVPRDMAYVLIEDAFPSGCEVTERGTADEEINGDDYRYAYSSLDVSNVDVRDDRIAFFARKVKAGKHTISYHLRAQTSGIYHVLPAQMQAMYDPKTRGESAENRVEIR